MSLGDYLDYVVCWVCVVDCLVVDGWVYVVWVILFECVDNVGVDVGLLWIMLWWFGEWVFRW